ncbi:MAG: PAS domain-containing protein, partial [Prolixibacteraceae bacterium]|nr:PAS domain-containing protein [Prolixibacteraceae bacterium]
AKNILFASPNYCQTFGVTEQEIQNKSFVPLIHEDDREAVLKSIESVMNPPYKTYHEERAKTVDGWRWFGWSLRGNSDSKGKTNEIVAVGRDITDKKEAEKALFESEEKFKAITEYSNDAIFLANKNGDYVYANKAASRMLGYSVNEISKLNIKDIGTQDISGNRFRKILEKGHLYDYFELKRKDGVIIKADLNAIVLPNGLLFAQCRDITGDIQRKIALKENEEKYRTLLENTGAGTGYYDLEGNLILFNNLAASLMGGNPEDFTGKNLFELYGELSGNTYLKRIKKAAHSEKSEDYEDEVQLPSGTSWYLSTYSRIKNAEGNVIGVQIISKDITERKELEIKLTEHQNRLEETVNQRTSELLEKNRELEEKNKELEEYNQLFVGREFRIKELKDRITELEKSYNKG